MTVKWARCSMAPWLQPRFLVIGAGMSGVLSAIKLAEAGFDDVVVCEKAERLGGTWRENTYPGVACDVPSQLYSFSFALNPEWSHTFSSGAEILAYMQEVADRHGLEQRIRYGTEVTRLEFDQGRWQVQTTQRSRRGRRGDRRHRRPASPRLP